MSLRSYVAHPDPVTAVACLVAVVLGSNGPFYPLYVIAALGWAQGHLAFLTMFASPLFLAIPLLARRHPQTARVTLWLVGTVNTIWCMKLLGTASEVGLFLLPCIMLAALLPPGSARLAGVGGPLMVLLIPSDWFGAPIMALTVAQDSHLASLNQFSAACLTGLLALRIGQLLPSFVQRRSIASHQ